MHGQEADHLARHLNAEFHLHSCFLSVYPPLFMRVETFPSI